MKTTLSILLLFSTALLTRAADATDPDLLAKTINQLLVAIEKSDAQFIRNGDTHNGKDAAEHLRKKYTAAKSKIKTPEDFVELCATKSSLSGKPYQIKTPDGKIIPAKDWLLARLAELKKTP